MRDTDTMKTRYSLVLVACLTLGLAPFSPEPHVIGKLRWIVGGMKGMRPIDWFDACYHGTPWLVLIAMLAYDGARWLRSRRPGP